jgi:hypothetical protein
MNEPDLTLLHAFGNEDVYADKLAGRGELIARLMMGALGYGSARAELAQQKEQRRQAEVMNDSLERLQAIKMQEVEHNARHTRPPIVIPAPVPGLRRWDGGDVPVGMDEGMVRMASAIGEDMAKEALSIEPLMGMAKNFLGSAGKAMGSIAPKMPSLGGAAQKVTGGLPSTAAAPKIPSLANEVGGVLGQGAKALASVPGKIQSGLKQSGITSLGGAAKTLGGLALGAGALYAGGKALKGGLNVMSREAQPAQYGSVYSGGSRVPYGINEYGQPDLRAPFTQ